MKSIFRIHLFGWKEGVSETSRTSNWWRVVVSAVHPLISGQTEYVKSTLHFHLILSTLAAMQYRSNGHNFPRVLGMHAVKHTINWLTKCSSMSATPLCYIMCDVTMVTCAGDSCSWFIDRCYGEGQSGQEKADIKVGKSNWQRDEASVIHLELSFSQMSHCTVCQSVAVHQRSTQTGFEACKEFNMSLCLYHL